MLEGLTSPSYCLPVLFYFIKLSAMKRTKLKIINRLGQSLEAHLEEPTDESSAVHGYALFAHCFTCGKNIRAARQITKALTMEGWATLRFDFTGLGESEGDFADTTFTSNINDIIDVAAYLTANYEAPKLIIGHSLGGAAVLHSSQFLESIKGTIVIASPADPPHVLHLFDEHLETIRDLGVKEVQVGANRVAISQRFIEDIASFNGKSSVGALRSSLLIFHSPQDRIVNIDEAAKIYSWARHPKSFISLDGANHMLTDPGDTEYVASCIAAWIHRYLD